MISSQLVLADRKQNKALNTVKKEMDLKVAKTIAEISGRQQVVDYELDVNAMVVSHAAANEMNAADYMVSRAGMSQVAQALVADRINHLVQADNRTLSRGGF